LCCVNIPQVKPTEAIKKDTDVFRVPDLPMLSETLQSQLKSKSKNSKTAPVTETSSQKGANRRGRKNQPTTSTLVENLKQENDLNDTMRSTQSQSQGTKRSSKKNNKGETALHLAVIRLFCYLFY